MRQGLGIRLVITCVILLVSGCAATVHSTKINPTIPFDPNNGVVSVQVVNNSDRLSGYNRNWTSVNIISLDTIEERKEEARKKLVSKGEPVPSDDKLVWYPDSYPIHGTNIGVQDSRIFLGMMPAGNYMVSSLYSYYYDGNVTSTVSMPVWETAGSFKVANGGFTDLGTLLFQPLLNIKKQSFWGAQNQTRAYVTRTAGELELASLVEQIHPQLKSSVNFGRSLSWEVDPADSFRREVAKISLNNLFGTEFISMQHHARGVLPTRLGQLRILDRNRQWNTLQLPTQSQILAAVDTPGQIVFGGERGLIFSSDSLDGVWAVTQPISPTQAIVWLGRYDGDYLALTNQGREYKLYRFKEIGSGWELMKELRVGGSIFTSAGGVFPIVSGNRLRLLADNQLWDYDRQTKTWKKGSGQRLLRMRQLDENILVGLQTSSWDGIGNQTISFDGGSTWVVISRALENIDKQADLSLPAVISGGKMITVSRIPMVKLGPREPDDKNPGFNILQMVVINGSDPGLRETWSYHGEVNGECGSIIPEISDSRRIYMLCDKGGLVYTEDLGETWVVDVEIDIAGLQAGFDQLVKKLRAGN